MKCKISLPRNTQTATLDGRFHFGGGDPGKVAWNRMLDRAHRNTPIESLLVIAIEHAVDQARGERVARAQTVDNFHLK